MYQPRNVPANSADIPEFLQQELLNLQKALSGPFSLMQLEKLYGPPNRLFEGMVVLADGTQWDPGSGAGFYGYRDGSWKLLG